MEKYKCEICAREFESLRSLSNHIVQSHKLGREEYYLKYINPNKGLCVECGKPTTFINLKDLYAKFCSCKCSCNNSEIKNKKKETCIKKYGCENPSQNIEIKNKKKETTVKNFGCEYPGQSAKVKNKKKETCKKNYGCENPMQNEEIKNKSKETCVKRYGCEYSLQSEKVKNKSKEKCMKNFGCENPSQNIEIKNKKKETSYNNFGCEYPMQNEKIAKKCGENNKLNFKKIQKRYPYLVKCEELISGPNGEILGHCKNSNCKNSKENGGYFELSTQQIQNRNIGINTPSDTNYLYCSEECKHECVLFRKSAKHLNNLTNDDHDIYYLSGEYTTFKNEVFARQLKENKEHTLNYCEKCHSTENLVVHHIQPQKLEPGYALDPPNGIVLCQKCHFEIGHEKGSECSTGSLANRFCK